MNALEIQGLRKTYANGAEALKGISLEVKAGDFFALLGANGAGKSTTIGLITTLLTKTAGTIRINGFDLDEHPEQAKSCIGLVPQEVNLNIFETCEQILLNQAGYYGWSRTAVRPHVESLLQQLGLWKKRKSIARHLSGGMKRRLMIARALVHRPSVLILDEPTAGVDIEIRRSMWEFLTRTNADGTTIILTTHYLEEAERLCKNIAIIDKGNLIENTSMHALLQSMPYQIIVFTTYEPLDTLPDLSPFIGVKLDANSFELRINENQSLNAVFERLSQEGIRVRSMQHKHNRLEELFMDRIRDAH